MTAKPVFRYFSILSFLFCFAQANHSQHIPDSISIEQQLKYVVSKTLVYNDYRTIKTGMFRELQRNINDTVRTLQRTISDLDNALVSNNATVDSVEQAMVLMKTDLDQAIKEKNSVSFFGVLLHKTVYNTILWAIIVALGAVLTIAIIAFKRSHSITRKIKTDLTELQEEYENYRKHVREKEEKTARKHLDEVLKYKKQLGI